MEPEKVLFVPCSIDGLPKESGSITLRCKWPARNWPDGCATVFDWTQRVMDYSVVIFQKAYLGGTTQELIRLLADNRTLPDGRRRILAFDLCDPDFLDDIHRDRLLGVLPLFDFAVAPTQPLVDWLAEYLPARLIPDRVDFSDLPDVTKHDDIGSDKPTLVWAGHMANVEQLEPFSDVVTELGLSLVIYAPARPIPFHEFWTKVVASGDVLLNPRNDADGRWKHKSYNKTVIALSLGMPVAESVDEVRYFCDPDCRRRVYGQRAVWKQSPWRIELSVAEWRKAIGEARSKA